MTAINAIAAIVAAALAVAAVAAVLVAGGRRDPVRPVPRRVLERYDADGRPIERRTR